MPLYAHAHRIRIHGRAVVAHRLAHNELGLQAQEDPFFIHAQAGRKVAVTALYEEAEAASKRRHKVHARLVI